MNLKNIKNKDLRKLMTLINGQITEYQDDNCSPDFNIDEKTMGSIKKWAYMNCFTLSSSVFLEGNVYNGKVDIIENYISKHLPIYGSSELEAIILGGIYVMKQLDLK